MAVSMLPTVLLVAAVVTALVLLILGVAAIICYIAERNDAGPGTFARRRDRRAGGT